MNYRPRHAKPVSLKEAALSRYGSTAATARTAPSVGRHARPEKPAVKRDHRATATVGATRP